MGRLGSDRGSYVIAGAFIFGFYTVHADIFSDHGSMLPRRKSARSLKREFNLSDVCGFVQDGLEVSNGRYFITFTFSLSLSLSPSHFIIPALSL